VDQTQREFLIEIEELVEQLFADLDELRTGAASNRSPRQLRDLIDRIFRRVHSIKGSAAASRLDPVNQIAHELENVLAAIRIGGSDFDAALLNTLAAAADALAESLSLAAAGAVPPSRHALFAQLQAASRAITDLPRELSQAILASIPAEIRQSLNEPEKQRLVSAIEEGSLLFVVATSFDLADFDQQFYQLKETLAKLGEIVSTSPMIDEARPEKINFRVLYASDETIENLETSVIDFTEVRFTPIVSGGVASPAPEVEQTSAGVATFAPVSSLANFVRADLDKLDHLISSTHELFRATTKALDVALSVTESAAARLPKLRLLNEQIRTRFLGVEEELINLRLVSLGPTLQRAARAGTAAARLAAKEIDFEIVGGELRIDKLLADAIADPLLHLVRNAVDHGIEEAGARLAGGKEQRGRIRIQAVSEGSQSRVRVTDDGRGIDPLLIAVAAKRLGLAATSVASDIERIDIDRSLRLIFRPGFTTLDSVSEVSGRGVGLDVVETAIEQVGGELRVSTEPGRGTTFEIRLPVTFGLVTTNVVVSAGNRYCIPAAQTLGIDAIDLVAGVSGANQIPQVSMRDLLGQPEEPEDASNQLHLITCQFKDERAGRDPESKCVGIVVDQVEGPQEVLVRNLGRHAGRWYGIAGATELRDGTVALVLDLPRLLTSSG
jgi:two-component system chemotaxis sensor kinase CheA